MSDFVPQAQPDGSVILDLEYPVTVTLRGPQGESAETVTQLRLHRLTGADLDATDGLAGMAMMREMIRRAGRLAPPVYARLDAADILRAAEVVAGFTGRSPKTGARSF